MSKLSANKVGLAVGIFAAIMHAAWALLVGTGQAQAVITLVLPLHFLDMAYTTLTFDWATALILVVVGFVGGYIIGGLYAVIWNWLKKVK